MRKLLVLIFTILTISGNAQKYALLDKQLAKPITYTDHVTQNDKFNKLFPVEKKLLPKFIAALEEIVGKLSSEGPIGEVKQYRIGCTTFKGLSVSSESGDKLDYVITSKCDNVIISMHLSDAHSSNSNNAFFIKTWIKYISSAK